KELEKVLPEVVTRSLDANQIRSVNYSEIIPVLTGAIQEQQEVINSQTATINDLEQKLNAILPLVQDNTIKSQPVQKTDVQINQLNIRPNPSYSSATVDYKIAGEFSAAKIQIFNSSGQKMGEYTLQPGGAGNIDVDVTSFSGGAYFCQLIIDNSIQEVKQFIVAK